MWHSRENEVKTARRRIENLQGNVTVSVVKVHLKWVVDVLTRLLAVYWQAVPSERGLPEACVAVAPKPPQLVFQTPCWQNDRYVLPPRNCVYLYEKSRFVKVCIVNIGVRNDRRLRTKLHIAQILSS